MPVRSIKLRLVVPRAQAKIQAAKALWSTHSLVNEAVAYYERMRWHVRRKERQIVQTRAQLPQDPARAGATRNTLPNHLRDRGSRIELAVQPEITAGWCGP